MKKGKDKANVVANVPLALKLKKDWSKYRTLYLLFLPILVYYIIFQYGPMFGLVIAFQYYKAEHRAILEYDVIDQNRQEQ